MEHLVLVLAVVFYLVIPGIGAFIVRYRWRTFRRRIVAASVLPRAGYQQMRRAASGAEDYLGDYRFIGSLQALQGDDIIWISNGSVSFAVDMKGQSVAVLPSIEGPAPEESPLLVQWKKLTHLTEGVRFLVAGRFYVGEGRGLFRGVPGRPLLVVMYGGSDATLVRRAVYSGRQRNEYWNQLTPASLAAGALALLTAAYVYLRAPGSRFEGLLSVTLSLVPISPLFPPGVVLFFLYRRFWRRGRSLRAERDIVRLPLRHYHDGIAGSVSVARPGGERYASVRVPPNAVGTLTARGARELSLSRHAERLRSAEVSYAFGRVGAGGALESPLDPLDEFVLVPGDPRSLAALCERQARRLEVTAIALAAVGIFANLYGILLLLSNLVR